MHMQLPRGMSDTGDLLVSFAWELMLVKRPYDTDIAPCVSPHVMPCSSTLTCFTRSMRNRHLPSSMKSHTHLCSRYSSLCLVRLQCAWSNTKYSRA